MRISGTAPHTTASSLNRSASHSSAKLVAISPARPQPMRAAVGERERFGAAARILRDRVERDHALALDVERAKRGARPLGATMKTSRSGRGDDQAEADREPVAEAERRAGRSCGSISR